MAAGVRFTKGERELIRKLLGEGRFWAKGELALADSIVNKLEKSEMLKPSAKATGIGWRVAVDAMREVLGAQLAAPPNPDPVWMIKVSNRIRELGLSQEDCRSIAQVLKKRGWKVYSFDYAIRYADTLLQEAQLGPKPGGYARREVAPLAM